MQPDVLSNLEFEFYLKPTDVDEFNHMLLDFKGRAIFWDNDAEEKVVARLAGHRLDLSRVRQSFDNIQEVFDMISPEISELGSHIISSNNCFVECCSREKVEKTPCSSLVYIDELVVEPAYRNQGVGTELLRRMSEIVDMDRTLVALKAVPILQGEGEQRTPRLKKQLKHFYRKLGFNHSGEHYMVKDGRECHAQRSRAVADKMYSLTR